MHGPGDASFHSVHAGGQCSRTTAICHGRGVAGNGPGSQRPGDYSPGLPAISKKMVNTKIEIEQLKVSYGQHQALKGITFDVFKNEIIAIIGPAQSGKSTFLK